MLLEFPNKDFMASTNKFKEDISSKLVLGDILEYLRTSILNFLKGEFQTFKLKKRLSKKIKYYGPFKIRQITVPFSMMPFHYVQSVNTNNQVTVFTIVSADDQVSSL